MKHGKTSSGFEFELDDEVLDDYELLEMLTELDEGRYDRVTRTVEKLLGKEQKEKLKEHIRKDGKVSASEFMNEIAEIFQNANDSLKN